jgi:hypothetical protein
LLIVGKPLVGVDGRPSIRTSVSAAAARSTI